MDTAEINCQCHVIEQFEGREAQDYAHQHLKKISVDGAKWEIHYECLATGIQWVMDFPQGEAQGGGPPRLRKLLNKI
jgi:hypothetical protein